MCCSEACWWRRRRPQPRWHWHRSARARSRPPPTGRPPANSALGGHAFLWAIGLNSFGTIFLVGGSLYSIARRRRVRPNLWIGAGALVVALATGLSRADSYSLVYAGQLVGIALMFSGFAFTGRPVRSPQRVPGLTAPT